MPPQQSILTLNGGSSSIRFAFYSLDDESPSRWASGKLDGIGGSHQKLIFHDLREQIPRESALPPGTSLVDWIDKELSLDSIAAVGHRVVHGMQRTGPEIVTEQLLDDLRKYSLFDPEHLPREIDLMNVLQQRNPKLLQVACFDTAFHRTMPRVARMLPIPRRFEAQGIERYGFHGLSYTYLMQELTRVAGAPAANGRVILAHLGNGASMAALHGGKCIDTSMGFTPAGGLLMGTRAGDLDAGLAAYLLRSGGLSPDEFSRIVHLESGLLGVSETSSDMRDLFAAQSSDVRAAEAVDLFCYQARKWIGAFAATLGGLDTLVFAGGIGENAPEVRTRMCAGLGFLGVDLDETKNAENAAIISSTEARCCVRMIPTDEESVIANVVFDMLKSRKEATLNGRMEES